MPTLVHTGKTGERSERDALLAFLEAQRGALRRAVLGLTDEQAASRPSASELSLGGLIKHAASCEDNWVQTTLMGRPGARERDESNWHQDFQLTGDETVAGVLEEYAAVARATEETIRGLPDLEGSVPLPEAPWFPAGMRVDARWVLLHLIEEAARHAGHADIIRESLDGKTSYVLIAEETGKAF
ncbi:DinB family protein [Streptomyces sp. SPB162]|uniref:DinB family protein n=1 Tax=Streptomyces sp. SPB162 TaxID=2940560 RepID=UPI00240583A7|nr:DinB family protein [Streptomyces sp. SPB162]MDF9814745.1 putative damage-inducible protein DinB [Streptomyces sp. SPB162]